MKVQERSNKWCNWNLWIIIIIIIIIIYYYDDDDYDADVVVAVQCTYAYETSGCRIYAQSKTLYVVQIT
jgi:hypothetical protein